MLLVYRLVASAICAALIVSACQPKADSVDTNNTVPTSEAATTVPDTVTDEPEYSDNNPSADDMVADVAPMTAMQADYTKSLTRMSDEMMIGMGYNDPDTTFAKSMLGHRRGALDIANLQLKYGSDSIMRQLAQRVINSQQSEINIINKWLASHPDIAKPKLETPFVQQEYLDSLQLMHQDITSAITDPIADVAFAHVMLAHYSSAGKMAKIELKYGTDKDMLALARQIIETQEPTISDLQNWLAANSASLDNDSLTDDDIEDDDAINNGKSNDDKNLATEAVAAS